jgi:hypothetical protein
LKKLSEDGSLTFHLVETQEETEEMEEVEGTEEKIMTHGALTPTKISSPSPWPLISELWDPFSESLTETENRLNPFSLSPPLG